MQKLMTKTEIMKLVASGKVHECFDHSIEGTFDVTAMREWAEDNAVVMLCPISDVLSFILTNRVFEMERAFDLDENSWANDPAMCVVLERNGQEEHLLIDGIHRIIRRHHAGLELFKCYMVPESKVVRPDMTQWQHGTERGIDWGDDVVDGQIVKRT
jgi:hypothetical protein